MRSVFRVSRVWSSAVAALVAVALLATSGCGGGGGGGGGPPAGPPPPGGNVTVSGTVTFDFVPTIPGLGLDYDHTVPKPARGVSLELLNGTTVIATGTTDGSGAYSFSVAQNLDVSLRVRAEMLRSGSPGWDFQVLDNTAADALYVLAGTVFTTGAASSTHNLHAASGWNGSTYAAVRSAAPFAILDVVYDATQLVMTAAPTTSFPALRIYWSTANVPAFGADGVPDPDSGEIGSSFFTRGSQAVPPAIFVLGAADADTDEYDRHVIAHEWGHYLEAMFSRSDSIGGPHAIGDQLDPRVAFGEGWGNAFSAMVTSEAIYSDVTGSNQAHGFAFDIEGPLFPGRNNPAPGWYSEESLQELIYDLFDSRPDSVGDRSAMDNVALGFAPIYDVLQDRQRTSAGLTSVFPFVTALREARLADAPLVDAMIGAHNMTLITDEYGSAETHFGVPESPDLQTVYDQVAVGGAPVNVCSLDSFRSPVSGSTNKLGSRRFVRFTVLNAGQHTIRAQAVAPLNDGADPDMVLHLSGPRALSNGPPSAACTVATPQECRETFSGSLPVGNYVLEVYEWTNTNSADEDYPPIGRTCFDVTVTSP
jgi:hypothetical protein